MDDVVAEDSADAVSLLLRARASFFLWMACAERVECGGEEQNACVGGVGHRRVGCGGGWTCNGADLLCL